MKDYNLKWEEHFNLDNISPSGLIRIKNRYNKSVEIPVGTKLFRKCGKPMGWKLSFNHVEYYIHRIIWVLLNGSISPSLVIDHLDGNPFNNSILNLSLKTQKDNVRNKSKYTNNTSGTTGVELFSNANGNIYYRAKWYNLDGFPEYKYFSVDKLGNEAAKTLAIAHRESQLLRLTSEGLNYTERHGT